MSDQPQRTASVSRRTRETNIELTINIDGQGVADIETPVGFFNHMLELLSHHSRMDLTVRATGDSHVDDHHLVEDVGISLGAGLLQAIGDKAGIRRYGSALVPMDEALVQCAVDFSGRPHLAFTLECGDGKIGRFDVELAEEFFRAVSSNAQLTLHVRQLSGANRHHIIEAAFKAVARALRQACETDPRASGVPSTKGVL